MKLTNIQLHKKKKDAKKAKVDEEVAKAKRAIDSSTTNDAVDQAKDSGVTTIIIFNQNQ